MVQATVPSDPLLKIHFITDVALMLDDDKKKSPERARVCWGSAYVLKEKDGFA